MGKQSQKLVESGGRLLHQASQVKMYFIWGLGLAIPFLILLCIFPSGTVTSLPYHRIVVSQLQGPSLRARSNHDEIFHRKFKEKPSTSSSGEPDTSSFDEPDLASKRQHDGLSSKKWKKHTLIQKELDEQTNAEESRTKKSARARSVRKPDKEVSSLGKEISANEEEDPESPRSGSSKHSTGKPGREISSLRKEIGANEDDPISIADAEEAISFPTKEKTSQQRLRKERFPKSAKMGSNPEENDAADLLFLENADREEFFIGDDLDDQLAQLQSQDDSTDYTSQQPEKCRYYKGRWMIDSKDPPYMESTCSWMSINDQKSCEVINKSTNPIKWRWKPSDCNMENFEIKSFLKLMQRKSLAFVGDNLAKAQMQTLVCLLAQVEKPSLVYDNKDNNSMSWHFDSSNITISMVWSPYLVQEVDENGSKKLYLDKLDTKWAVMVPTLDLLVLGVGSLFIEPTIYMVRNEVVGCYACKDLHAKNNITKLSMYSGFRSTMKSTIMGVGALPGFEGITLFLQPFGFEGNGSYHSVSMKMKAIQEDELYQAYKRGSISNQSKMEVLHTSLVSMSRDDPMKVSKNPTCLVHSPLADTWNQFLQHTLIRLLKS